MKIFAVSQIASFIISSCFVTQLANRCEAQVSRSGTIHSTPNSPFEPAIPAILKTFETFEVVGMPAAHGQKDIDDFILLLIRDPRFPTLVNDVVVECGNLR